MSGVVEVARSVLAELDLDTVLERVLQAAQELTGARYAALGVLGHSRRELSRFLTVGIDEATRVEIGEPPHGRGERIMGFGHRVYRAEDPRSRVLKRVAKELGSPRVAVAEELEQVAHEAIAKKSPGHSWTNVEYWSAVVLDVAEVPPPLAPAMFACSRTAGWSAHILEQKRLGVLVRPSAKYIGPGARSLQEV